MVNESLPEVDFRFCPARGPTPPLCGGVFCQLCSFLFWRVLALK